jgi:DNA adenine methylase
LTKAQPEGRESTTEMGTQTAPLLEPDRKIDGGPRLSPPLKWAGGKRWLVPYLESVWSGHASCRLVEPFCGGLAVALGLNPERALLNDANPHLINFYRQLQMGLTGIQAPENDRSFYYEARERFNELIRSGKAQTPEAARLFHYLNRTGYNGLCRFNSQGFFNVPFGRYKTISYASDFLAYQPVLSRWHFIGEDFEALDVKPGDFVYADPPYDVPFVSYSKGGFAWSEQERLAEWLGALPCPVIASNQATERILGLYERQGFEIRLLEAPRRISCTGDRSSAKEMLALKGHG